MNPATALTIGNFDGVHHGHRTLLARARTAIGAGGRVVVLTFDPLPAAVLRPGHAPGRLVTAERRRRLLQEAGADEVRTLDPRDGLLELAPEAFVEREIRPLAPAILIEGPDFRFGRGRSGDVRTLAALGLEVHVEPTVERRLDDMQVVPVRSSLVRRLLAAGRVRDAAALLGRPHLVEGPAVPGDRRGRTIGVPTVNVDVGALALPADGIYAGRATAPDGRRHPAAISVGTKPTFGGRVRTCEAHLCGWNGPPEAYGWTVEIEFEHWLRGQVRYDDVGQLVAQIRRDVARTRELAG